MMPRRTLLAAAVLASLAGAAYPQEATTSHRWACWTAGKGHGLTLEQYFDLHNRPSHITSGDQMTPCSFDPLVAASGIELEAGGTGTLLEGYGGFRRSDRRVFRTEDHGRVRWSVNVSTNVMTLLSETDSGDIRTKYWRIVERLSDNLVRVTALQDDGQQYYWWRVGSPEDLRLQGWRQCRDRNKGKGLDASPCDNPVAASGGP